MRSYIQTEPSGTTWRLHYLAEFGRVDPRTRKVKELMPDFSSSILDRESDIQGDEGRVREFLSKLGTVSRFDLELEGGGVLVALGIFTKDEKPEMKEQWSALLETLRKK